MFPPRLRHCAAVAIATAIGLPIPLRAQEVTGGLQGRLVSGGAPLSGAVITVNSSTVRGRNVLTGKDGYFRLSALPVGTYAITTNAVGFRDVTITGVAVPLGQTVSVGDVQTEIAAIDLPPIVVSAERPLLDPASTAVTSNILARQFEMLPIGRDVSAVAALLPQVNESHLKDGINIGGSPGTENMYYIDGVNVTDPYVGMSSTRLPHNFVREVQVREGGYEAEFGRAMGGIVDVITFSGSDQRSHGVFAYFNGAGLTATSAGGAASGRSRGEASYDLGVSAGGAFIPGRLWYFGAYNPTMETREIELPSVGFHEDRLLRHSFAGKVSWRAGAETDVMFNITGDPSLHHRVGANFGLSGAPAALLNPDPLLSRVQVRGFNALLSMRTLLNGNTLLQLSAGRYTHSEKTTGDSEVGRSGTHFEDYIDGNTWSGGYGQDLDTRSNRVSLKAAVTRTAERHTFKAGAELERNQTRQVWGGTGLGSFLSRHLEGGDTVYMLYALSIDADARLTIPTLFLQDSWRVTDRLVLNPGLRWAAQRYYAGGSRSEWQPRFGAAYQLDPSGKSKVFASAGRYYQQQLLFFPIGNNSGLRQDQVFFDTDPRATGASAITFPGQPPVTNAREIRGEHSDELVAGYERVLGAFTHVAIRGTMRELRSAITFAWNADKESFAGNIGEAPIDFLPKPKRQYRALELSIDRNAPRLKMLASYVHSRTFGNYPGSYPSDSDLPLPGNQFALQLPEQIPNGMGLLPNDRPHAFKFAGSYSVGGAAAGVVLTARSGTPLNDFGATWLFLRPTYLVPRGGAGRTPAVWDLNVRLSHDSPLKHLPGKIVLDMQHVGNPRKAVVFDQQHYFTLDNGQQSSPNPNYGRPIKYQLPASIRLGWESAF